MVDDDRVDRGASGGRTVAFFAGDTGGSGTITVSAEGPSKTISVTATESVLPIGRQATSATSVGFLVATLVAIAAGAFVFFRYCEARRELEDVRKRGGGDSGGTA